MKQIVVNTLQELDELSRALTPNLKIGDVVCLDGELGSGKSQFVRFCANNLGFAGEVTSPTFCFLNEYEIDTNFSIYHFDLYRLESASELSEIGFDEFGYSPRDGVAFIEWSKLFSEEMNDDALHIEFSGHGAEQRTLSIESSEKRSNAILEGWLS